MNILEDDFLNKIAENVAKSCDLENWKFKRHENIKTIENYFGILVPLTVTGRRNESEEELHLLLKLKPETAEDRMKLVLKYLYDTEHYVYTRLFPLFGSCQLNVDDISPKCFYADMQPGHEVIVLQNMTFSGFMRYPNRFLDYHHAIVALKSLAKYHSLSLISIESGKISTENDFVKPYTDTHPVELNIALKLCLESHSQLLKGEKCEKFLRSLAERYNNIRVDSFNKSKLIVFGHGDYWKENILFKYVNEKPTQACILDYQMVQLMSASQDFLTFLLVSVDTKTRMENYENFISAYIKSLDSILIEHNIDTQRIVVDFQHDLKVVAENCVIMAVMAFALWYGLEDQTLVKSKDTTDKVNAEKRFTQTICEILNDLNRIGLVRL
ncbi:unnamed protein product [Leptosia nina]|uniref:CHK kinase-like domain-containing protein n=1 Tax=Leptosia nina TaxID=320188 RepID=A0AAV1JAP0_9NEOP